MVAFSGVSLSEIVSEFQKCGCPHCGTEIEFDVADSSRECNCPACGKVLKLPPPVGKIILPPAEPPPNIVYVQAPPQTVYVTEKPKTGCLTQIITAFLIFMLICFIIFLFSFSESGNNLAPTTQNKPMVTAEISVAGGNLIVSNTGKEAWKSVNVYVNSEPPDGYGCRLDNVKPLASKAIPLTEFVKPDGERFDPITKKVLNACIGGEDYTYEKFSF
jgi:ribosomal protein S27E